MKQDNHHPVKPSKIRETFLVYGSPMIEQPEIDEVVDSIRSGWLGTGPKVQQTVRTDVS